MKKVKQGGRVLTVEDEFVPRYLAQGYSVIDDDGNVLEKGAIVTLDQALIEIARLKTVEKQFTEENAKLTTRIAELEAKLEAAVQDESKVSDKENRPPKK